MKKRFLKYMKHLIITIIIAIPLIFIIGILVGNIIKYGKDINVRNLNNEGPYIFFENDSLISTNYIKGNEVDGFSLDTKNYSIESKLTSECYYALDSSSFSFNVNLNIKTPNTVYNDANKIIAVSDIESNYKTFRNFLINSKVIDKELNWIFDKGHLVLVGDMIDRSYFTTQILWFIYKLEQDARKKGGYVHFILGNHEVMNMRGNHSYAASKYRYVSTILKKKQFELYSRKSLIGKWLESKNTLELINGNLFVHGGIHPSILDIDMNIDQINIALRKKYFESYYPKKNRSFRDELLYSTKTSPFWYRGYFKGEITTEDVNKTLEKFNSKRIIVGHTIQDKVNKKHNGKIIGIDIKHPQDYYKYWPKQKSEGLLIENNNLFRLYDNGKKTEKL